MTESSSNINSIWNFIFVSHVANLNMQVISETTESIVSAFQIQQDFKKLFLKTKKMIMKKYMRPKEIRLMGKTIKVEDYIYL